MSSFWRGAFSFLALLFLSGCAVSSYLDEVSTHQKRKDYTLVYKTLAKAAKKNTSDSLLWNMQLGFFLFSYSDKLSCPFCGLKELELADTAFNTYQSEGLLSSALEGVSSTLTNDLVNPYKGTIYEAGMINFYKALLFTSVGRDADARVEFNRANDRQRHAKDYYAKEISRASKELEEGESNSREKDSSALSKAISSVDLSSAVSSIERKYSNLKRFSSYENFINPVIPYVSGLYFMHEKDYSKSVDLLKEAYGISRSRVIADDLALLDRRKAGDKTRYTWIILEDGHISTKNELKFSELIGVYGSAQVLFVVALPVLNQGGNTYDRYFIESAGGAKRVELQEVANFSALFASEFNKQLPYIITRSVLASTTRAVLSYLVSSSAPDAFLSYIFGIFGGMVSYSVSNADIRSSRLLANRVLVTRLKNPSGNSGKSVLFGDSTTVLDLHFSNNCSDTTSPKLGEHDVDDATDHLSISQDGLPRKEKLCSDSDNIVYVRSEGGVLSHFLVKGRRGK